REAEEKAKAKELAKERRRKVKADAQKPKGVKSVGDKEVKGPQVATTVAAAGSKEQENLRVMFGGTSSTANLAPIFRPRKPAAQEPVEAPAAAAQVETTVGDAVDSSS
ncbi:unnamed protein product, partial [Sphacelaria rigidula]